MRITAAAAREYFAHPSQQGMGLDPDHLTDDFIFYAAGPICGAFHPMPWPGLWMAHYGAKPEGRGRLIAPARAILEQFTKDHEAFRILGWTPANNKAANAFARRLGFIEDGRMPSPDGEIIMTGWKP